METKAVNLKNIPISLQEIQENYEYIDPVLNRTFTEFKEPVIDSEGFLREKNEPHVNKSLYRKNVDSHERLSVNIIESVDIKNIQKDYQGIENKYDEMLRMFSIMMGKMDDQTKHTIEQNRKIDEMSLKMQQKDQDIQGLKEDIALISKQSEYQHEVMSNKLDVQAGIIANQEKMLNAQVIHIEEQARVIKQQSIEIVNLKKFVGLRNANEANKNKVKTNKKIAFDVHNNAEKEADFENIPLPNERWMGQEFNPLTGMRDTFSIFTPASVLTQPKQENELRKCAFGGDIQRMTKLLNRNKSIVNGRGMPDSICSRSNSFYDKTALMLAAKEGHVDCVRLLIENEAEINFLDRDNFTALDYAQQHFHKEVADVLKRHGAVNGADVLDVIVDKSGNMKSKR